MSFYKKLQIKIFSVALLVSLVSYGGLEDHVLSQQFELVQVVSEKKPTTTAFYSVLGISIHETLINTYVTFDFISSLELYNTNEKIVFNCNSFNSHLLKSNRSIASFLTERSSISRRLPSSYLIIPFCQFLAPFQFLNNLRFSCTCYDE